MAAYYNEFDDYAAEWLRNLIVAGLIAPGDVDNRSILDVKPDDLRGYTQCHFFAGIGVWSYALRLAGWPDDRPVWTGSCPCQPFSVAGASGGFADERHLWPDWHFLIEECRPPVVFGEQVEAAIRHGWLDLVQSDMEGIGYAFGAVGLPAAGVGAPHIRQRLWFVADADHERRAGEHALLRAEEAGRLAGGISEIAGCGKPSRMGDDDARLEGLGRGHQAEGGRGGAVRSVAEAGELGGVADGTAGGQPMLRSAQGEAGQLAGSSETLRSGPTNSHWRDADWLFCRDGKWRPIEASPQPLADGSAESLGRVRPEVIAKIEEEINASAMETEIRRPEVLRALQETLGAQAGQVWTPGRIPGLHEAPFLLAFLRQLQEQGWRLAQGRALHGAEAEGGGVRVLRDNEATTGASHQRELVGQPPGESSDAVHFLSSLLARHSQEAWAHNYETYAEIGFPLGTGSPARVGRLRAYGNAIVAQVAAEVIRAYMECRP